MGVELDTLEIQIHSSADEASAGIDRLTNALNQLKSVAKGGAGLTAVANQLSKLNSALSSIQVNEGRIKGLNQALKPLKALADLKGVKLSSSIATQMKAIGEAANTLDETCAQRLASVGNGLSALAGAKDIHLSSSIANQLKAIGEAAQGVNHTDLAGLGQKTMQLKEALLPLTELGKSSFSGMVKSLEKIGDITETLGNVETMQKFGDSVQEVARKMEPLVNQATKVYVALKWLPDVVNKIANSNEKMSLTFIRSAKNVNIFGTSIKSLGIRSAIKDFSAFAQRVYGVMKNWVTESNNYIENLNLFTVSMLNACTAGNVFVIFAEGIVKQRRDVGLRKVGQLGDLKPALLGKAHAFARKFQHKRFSGFVDDANGVDFAFVFGHMSLSLSEK